MVVCPSVYNTEVRGRKWVRSYWRRGGFAMLFITCYAPPLIGGGIKRCFCLTSVCRLSVCRVHLA